MASSKKVLTRGDHPSVYTVAKTDGSPRLYINIDHRNTINRPTLRGTWPMPDIESHIDTVDSGCEVHNNLWHT